MTELTKEEILREIEDRLLFEIDVTLEKQGLRVMGEHQAAVTISCYTNALRLLREVFLGMDRKGTKAKVTYVLEES
jgi:hypothetical protein